MLHNQVFLKEFFMETPLATTKLSLQATPQTTEVPTASQAIRPSHESDSQPKYATVLPKYTEGQVKSEERATVATPTPLQKVLSGIRKYSASLFGQ